jgi:hypothetical protein
MAVHRVGDVGGTRRLTMKLPRSTLVEEIRGENKLLISDSLGYSLGGIVLLL